MFDRPGLENPATDSAVGLNCSPNTAYQYALDLRQAYNAAFGIEVVSTKDGLHIVSIDEVQVQNDRALAILEKHLLPTAHRLQRSLHSLKQTNQQYSLSGRTQALLQAALLNEEESDS